MGIRLIIEGNAAYEIDEDCLARRQEEQDSVPEDALQQDQRESRNTEN